MYEEMHTVEVDYGYTPWRRFLAWVGMITLIAFAIIGVYAVYHTIAAANAFVDASLTTGNNN